MRKTSHHVVVVGGGFAGLNVAKGLKDESVEVTLIDRRNFHLFQPLLYQVATGGLSPGDIAQPLRAIFNGVRNVDIVKAEVTDINPETQTVTLLDGEVAYDTLIVATGSSHFYFGNEQWEAKAPGLKTVEDALEIRRRILLAFEAAEREPEPEKRRAWLTFVVVGGGPTGVELAGALAELARNTLAEEFRRIDPTDTKIILLEAIERVLPPYPEPLSEAARRGLEKLGVDVRTDTRVIDVQDEFVVVKRGEEGPEEKIDACTTLWGAGIKASGLGQVLGDKTGAELDRAGRVLVTPELFIPNVPNIFVLGDLAHAIDKDGQQLPGLASVAMQQGYYVADVIKRQLRGESLTPFNYFDKGTMAIIGRNSAVAEVNGLHFKGFVAWLAWVFVHIYYLIGFDNKVLVLFQWAWNYITFSKGARLITNEKNFRLIRRQSKHRQQQESMASS